MTLDLLLKAATILFVVALLYVVFAPVTHKAPTGFVDVRDFGALIDGKTDDSFAIEMAVAFARKNNKMGVYFPPGVYALESKIPLP